MSNVLKPTMSQLDDDNFAWRDDKGVLREWYVPKLWELSKNLPHVKVPLSKWNDLIQWWLTLSKVKLDGRDQYAFPMEDLKRVRDASLLYPIIVSADGTQCMDGMHRLIKAWFAGEKEILVVQFKTDPEPDRITDPATDKKHTESPPKVSTEKYHTPLLTW